MLKDYSTLILRIGLGIVFLWFGVTSILQPEIWSSLVPSLIPISGNTVIIIMAIFQVLMAILLIIGLFTRLASLLLAISMIPIIMSLGYNDIAVRDLGIFTALLSLSLSENKKLSLDSKFRD